MAGSGTGGGARGRPPRSTGERLVVQARIIATAARLFQVEGYRAVSMRRLAAEAGCTTKTLYAYFRTKADILRDIWIDLLEALFADLAVLAEGTPEPRARLEAIAQGYVGYWLANPEHYRVVFMTEGVSQGDVGVFITGPRTAAWFALFSDALRAGLERPSEDEVRLKTDALVCAMHGVAHNLVTISAYPWSAPDRLVALAV